MTMPLQADVLARFLLHHTTFPAAPPLTCHLDLPRILLLLSAYFLQESLQQHQTCAQTTCGQEWPEPAAPPTQDCTAIYCCHQHTAHTTGRAGCCAQLPAQLASCKLQLSWQPTAASFRLGALRQAPHSSWFGRRPQAPSSVPRRRQTGTCGRLPRWRRSRCGTCGSGAPSPHPAGRCRCRCRLRSGRRAGGQARCSLWWVGRR